MKEPWQHLAAASMGEGLCRGVRVGFSAVQCVEKGRTGQYPSGINPVLFLKEGETMLAGPEKGADRIQQIQVPVEGTS